MTDADRRPYISAPRASDALSRGEVYVLLRWARSVVPAGAVFDRARNAAASHLPSADFLGVAHGPTEPLDELRRKVSRLEVATRYALLKHHRRPILT